MTTRLLFWGTAAIAVPTLERLSSSSDVSVVGVVTRPDAPVGRHQELAPSPVKLAAARLGIPVFQPETLKDPAVEGELRRLAPDVGLVFAFGRIIPETLLAVPPKGTLNLHPSLLPRWRGPSPIQAAILAGDAETGVTLMLLDAEMDHGPIVAQERVTLAGDETGETLSATMAERAATLAADALPRFLAGDLVPREQDHAAATTCPLLDRDSGRVDWTADAATIERMSRAYLPWPGIWTEWSPATDGNGLIRTNEPVMKTVRVKLADCRIGGPALAPGALALADGRLAVGTGEGTVSFGTLQLEGKKALPVDEVVRGMAGFTAGRFA